MGRELQRAAFPAGTLGETSGSPEGCRVGLGCLGPPARCRTASGSGSECGCLSVPLTARVQMRSSHLFTLHQLGPFPGYAGGQGCVAVPQTEQVRSAF